MAKYGNKYVEVDDADEDERGGSRERGPIARHKRNGIRSGNESGSQDGQHSRDKTIDDRDDRQSKRGIESQLTSNLDPFTQAAKTTVRHLSETQAAIQSLSDMYAKHASDVEQIAEIQRRLSELEKECREKDEKIRKQKDGLIVILEAGRDKEDKLKEREQDIIQDRKALDLEREDFARSRDNAEKRSKMLEAERQRKQDEELKTLKAAQERELEHEMERLGQERDRLDNDYRKTLTDLKADMAKLSEDLKVEKKRNEESRGDLASAEAKCDDLNRVKDSFKQETKELKMRLKAMENEFGLGCQGIEF
jgi:chromosome segregation ATPase